MRIFNLITIIFFSVLISQDLRDEHWEVCEDLNYQECSMNPFCEWTDEGCIYREWWDDDSFMGDADCSDLSLHVCNSIPFCHWSYYYDMCTTFGFDWDDDEWWDDSTGSDDWNFEYCDELDFELCNIVPSCSWSADEMECTFSHFSPISFTIENVDLANRTLDVYIHGDQLLFNFEVFFSGIIIENIYGGITEAFDFEIEWEEETVYGYVQHSGDFPIANDLLFTVSFQESDDTICIYNGQGNGFWGHHDWDDGEGVDASDCVILEHESEDSNYFSNILNGYSPEYFTSLNNGITDSVITFVTFETSDDLDFGDDIGLLDYDGIINYGECPEERGEVLVGSAQWNGSTLTIPVYASVVNCEDNALVLPGFISGNEFHVVAYDESHGIVRNLEILNRNDLIWGEDFYILNEVNFQVDLNSDGVLDILDIVVLVNLILSYEYDSIADLNGDGILDVLDIVRMVNEVLS